MDVSGGSPVAVITGAASGFGFAVADALADRNHDVVVVDRDGEQLAEKAGLLRTTHPAVRIIDHVVDVSSEEHLTDAAAAVGAELGRCDLLWANVGVQHFGAVETISDDVWRWVLDVNVIGAARTVRAFLPLLRRTASSRIAVTSSANALAPTARLGAYQASKYALVGLAETLRMELAADGIGVTVVYPSGMMTRHLESSALARPPELGGGDVADEDLNAMFASRPMGPADITTAEDAVARSIDAVLAGQPHVITHGDLAVAVAEHHAAIDAALSRIQGATP